MQLQLATANLLSSTIKFLLRNLESIFFSGPSHQQEFGVWRAFNVAQDESEGTSWDLAVILGKLGKAMEKL